MRALLLVLALAGCQRLFELKTFERDAPTVDGPAAADLVAHYPMDDITAGILTDVAGGHAGHCGSCPAPTNGHIDGALLFDGVTDQITVPSAPPLETTSGFTVAAWSTSPRSVRASSAR